MGKEIEFDLIKYWIDEDYKKEVDEAMSWNRVHKKIINGIEVTSESFERVSRKDFDTILSSILNEENTEYTGFMEFESWDEIDFVPSYFTDDITDGTRYAMLSRE